MKRIICINLMVQLIYGNMQFLCLNPYLKEVKFLFCNILKMNGYGTIGFALDMNINKE